MKARIDPDGTLNLMPEGGTEAYGVQEWLGNYARRGHVIRCDMSLVGNDSPFGIPPWLASADPKEPDE